MLLGEIPTINSISYTMSTWSSAFVGWPTWSADLVGPLENNDILFSLHFFTNIHILHSLFYPYFARVTLAGMESNRIPVNQNVLPVSCVISFFAGAPYNPGPPMGGGWGRYNLISFMYLCWINGWLNGSKQGIHLVILQNHKLLLMSIHVRNTLNFEGEINPQRFPFTFFSRFVSCLLSWCNFVSVIP